MVHYSDGWLVTRVHRKLQNNREFRDPEARYEPVMAGCRLELCATASHANSLARDDSPCFPQRIGQAIKIEGGDQEAGTPAGSEQEPAVLVPSHAFL